MLHRISQLISVLLLLVMVFIAGCHDNRASLFLWPDLDDQYAKAVDAWTRSGALYSGIETQIIAHATLKSRSWQKAYIKENVIVYSLSTEEQQALSARLEAFSETETEVFLSLYSPRPEQARLRFNDPLWSIFIEEEDAKIYPLEIKPVREPLAALQVFYPYVRQWRENYILKFPGAARDSMVMIMTGPVGRIEFSW